MIKVIVEDFIEYQHIRKVVPLYKELIAMTRVEKGNIEYNLFVNQEDKGHFIFIEQWQDMDAIDEHIESAHFKRIVPIINKYQYAESTYLILDALVSEHKTKNYEIYIKS